jgi:hypothetical protein
MKRINILLITILSIFSCAGKIQTVVPDTGISSFFSADYKEARNKFLGAAKEAEAQIHSFVCPVSGPAGESLYIDVATFGSSNPKAILVLGSGTHGVEGFAGSGIQTGFLREGIASKLKPHIGVVMIHAINPYGFAHLRRFNQDNVDLNRNFINHSEAYPRNKGYEELADAIAPRKITIWEDTKAFLHFIWYRLKKGKLELRQALTGGQYSHPQGLFFGGQSDAWSSKILREIALGYLSNAERVVIVDVHTGLGPHGHAEVILNVSENSLAYKRAREWWGKRVRTTVTGDSVSVHLQSSLKLAFPMMLPNSEVTAVSLEFGTYSSKEVFWALRAENWLHHHGGKDHQDAEKIKAEFLRIFYPNTEGWKLRIWKQGKEVVEQALAHL